MLVGQFSSDASLAMTGQELDDVVKGLEAAPRRRFAYTVPSPRCSEELSCSPSDPLGSRVAQRGGDVASFGMRRDAATVRRKQIIASDDCTYCYG